jgi:hypothetical protein
MSRWANLFTVLSNTCDTVDTIRRSGELPSIHSVAECPECHAPAALDSDIQLQVSITSVSSVISSCFSERPGHLF